MAPIPLPPLRPSRRSGDDGGGEGSPPGRRRGRVSRAVRWIGSPWGVWAGQNTIRNSASFIEATIAETRTPSGRDARFRTFDDGEFDLEATAFSYGISVAELERRFAVRRRQSAVTAYLCVGLALLSVGFWIEQVLAGSPAAGMTLLTLNALGFACVSILAAFYQGLVNFQVRAQRTVGWKEFLMTDHAFWPRF